MRPTKLEGKQIDNIDLAELIRAVELDTPDQIALFHKFREEAFYAAKDVYNDRVLSYNSDHEPLGEMIFGPLSLASELFKRARRLCGLLSPLRKGSFRQADLNRMADLGIDIINYASWLYATMRMVAKGNYLCDDAPSHLGPVDPRDSSLKETKPTGEELMYGARRKEDWNRTASDKK